MKEENPDRVFFRKLWYVISGYITEFTKSDMDSYQGETVRRIAHMKFIVLQQKLLQHARERGWLSDNEEKLAKRHLEELEKRYINGRCEDCG